MKSTYEKIVLKKRLITVGIILACAMILLILWMCFFEMHIYSMHPDLCEHLFDCTPTEFLSADLEGYEKVNNMQKKAYVDEDGWLVLDLTVLQCFQLRYSAWSTPFEELESRPYVEVSDDLKSIILYITPELREFSNQDWEKLDTDIVSILFKMSFILDEKTLWFENESIIYKEVDSVSGEVLFEDVFEGPAIISYPPSYLE